MYITLYFSTLFVFWGFKECVLRICFIDTCQHPNFPILVFSFERWGRFSSSLFSKIQSFEHYIHMSLSPFLSWDTVCSTFLVSWISLNPSFYHISTFAFETHKFSGNIYTQENCMWKKINKIWWNLQFILCQ